MKKLLGSVALVAAMALLATPAFASSGTIGSGTGSGQMSDSINNVRDNMSTLPILINYASYIIGVALGVAGVSKLKAHVDNPGQTPIKDGLGRLAAAGLFISLPFLLDMIRNTQAVGGGSASYTTLSSLTP